MYTEKVIPISVPFGLIVTHTEITGHALSANQDLGVKVAAPVGTLVGQLLFGWLADVVGRKRMCKSSGPPIFLLSIS